MIESKVKNTLKAALGSDQAELKYTVPQRSVLSNARLVAAGKQTIAPSLRAKLPTYPKLKVPLAPIVKLPNSPKVKHPGLPKVNLPPPSLESPFDKLPFPDPGDRIRADDFKMLSRALLLARDAVSLSGALFGERFGEARLALESSQYEIQRVMTVFGTEINDLNDGKLDNRKVIQVAPVELGSQKIVVVVTEHVETRRFAPNLLGLTHQEAMERLRALMADVSYPAITVQVPELVGLSLAEAEDQLSE